MGSNASKLDIRVVIGRAFRCTLLALMFLVGTSTTSPAEQRHVVAAAILDAFPYSYLGKDGKPAGIHIDLASAIAAAGGLDLEIRLMEWDSARAALERGEVEILLSVLSGGPGTWEFAMSEAYSNMEVSTFSRANVETPSSPFPWGPSAKKIGVHKMIADMETLGALPGLSQVAVSDAEGLFSWLLRQTVDMVVCPTEMGLRRIKDLETAGMLLQANSLPTRKVCFAARKDRSDLMGEFNQGLRRLKDNGEYYRLLSMASPAPLREEDSAVLTLPHLVFPITFTLIALIGYAIIERWKIALGRAAIWIVLAACVAVEVLFVCLSYLQEREASLKRVSEQLRTVTELNSMILINRIERAKAGVQSLQADPLLLNSPVFVSASERRQPLSLDDQVGDQAAYALRRKLEGVTRGWRRSEALLVDTTSLILLSTNPLHDGARMEGNSTIIQQAGSLRQGNIYLNIHHSSMTEDVFIEFYMPVVGSSFRSDAKTVLGIALLRIHLEEFLSPLPKELPSMGRSGEILLFRKEEDRYVCINNARLAPDTALALSFASTPRQGMGQAIGMAFEGKTGLLFTKDYRDVPVICAYQPIVQAVSGLTWAMIAKRDEREAFAHVEYSLRQNVLVAVSYALAISILGILVARSVSRRIKSLGDLTKTITNGNLDIQLRVEGSDDISQLAQSLKTMSDSLKKRFSLSEHLAGLGRLAAGMAHEVRTPLTSIRVILQSLEMQMDLEEDQREDFIVMQKEINRLNDLVKRFLCFAKPPDPDLAPLEINGLLKQTKMLLDARVEGAPIQVCMDLSLRPLWIMGDEAQLCQVFSNLCVNAVEAMPVGGLLTISSKRTPGLSRHSSAGVRLPADDLAALKDFIEVSVSDTGRGVPEKDRLAIFDPFFSTKEGGTGLGLAIAWSIVERHQGKILVDSGRGGGCTFRVILPAHGVLKNEENTHC